MFKLPKKLFHLKVDPSLYISLFFVFGLLMTYFAWRFALDKLEARRRIMFENRARMIENQMQKQALLYLTYIQGVASLVKSQPELTLDNFLTYLEGMNPKLHLPGLYAISLVEAVNDADLDRYIASVRTQTSENFDFSKFTVFPQISASDHFIVKYAKTLVAGVAPTRIGWDLASEPDRSMLITRARDTGTYQTSGLIQVHGVNGVIEPGFIVFYPIYRSENIPDTVADRRQNFVGTINSIFLSSLFQDVGFDQKLSQLNLDMEIIYNDTDDSKEIYDSFPSLKTSNQSKYIFSQILSGWGKNWIIKVGELPEFGLTKIDDRLPFLVLIGGFDLTLLLASIMYISLKNREKQIKNYQRLIKILKNHPFTGDRI